MRAAEYVKSLAARGRYTFTTEEAREALGVSGAAVRAALRRLEEKGELARPHRGFFAVVPPELRSVGCLPAGEFLPHLMRHLGRRYYAGLLSAAELHGAAHQRPQVFQVVTATWAPEISCGRVRVQFVARANASEVPILTMNTPRSQLAVSTAEATAFDLVGYPRQAGGLDNVATVLAELAEHLDPDALAAVAPLSAVAWAQRLGYLLDWLGQERLTGPLKDHVEGLSPKVTGLVVGPSLTGAPRDRGWAVAVNTTVEIDVDP